MRLRTYLNDEANATSNYDGETTMFDDGAEEGPDPPIGGGVMLADNTIDHHQQQNGHHFGHHGVAVPGGHPVVHLPGQGQGQGQGQGGVNVNGLMGAMGATAIDEDEEFGEGSEILAGD